MRACLTVVFDVAWLCVCLYILGHSKGGVYVCKYADVCIRQASVRRTWEGNLTIKLIIFKVCWKIKLFRIFFNLILDR